MSMRVVATAGHVDHGKSSLVLALTGTDPDRFPEEKSRGLTIDLGFAFTTLADGTEVGFVDVPGHVRFVKNMLAGVGAVEVAMLVVAANEGWMPQSEEHVQILDLLGVGHGLVVLSKADLVDAETLELARLELDDHLAGTALADWPVVSCDARGGRGVDDVAATLATVLAAAPAPRDLGRPRLWIDRVFAAKGAGTVVTGTLGLGGFAVDDEVVVEPGARRARIRSIESHGTRHESIGPGSRVALNLAGIDHTEVHRGDAVVRPGDWVTPLVVDIAVTPAVGRQPTTRRLPKRGELTIAIGSGEQRARWRLLDATERFARLRLEHPLPLAPGDRLVARSSGRRATVAGGEIVDVEPARRTADALTRLPLAAGMRLLHAHRWLAVADIGRLAGLGADDAVRLATRLVADGHARRIGEELVGRAWVDTALNDAVAAVAAFHRSHPHERGVELAAIATTMEVDPARARAVLADDTRLVIDRDVVRSADHEGRASELPGVAAFLEALAAAPFAPPGAADHGIGPATLRALAAEGAIVELDGIWFATSALAAARRRIARAVVERDRLSVGDVRELLATSRKYVLPLLNRMESEGITRRRGDERIPGPRAAAAASDD